MRKKWFTINLNIGSSFSNILFLSFSFIICKMEVAVVTVSWVDSLIYDSVDFVLFHLISWHSINMGIFIKGTCVDMALKNRASLTIGFNFLSS